MRGPLQMLAPKVQTVRIEGAQPSFLDTPSTRDYLATRFHIGLFWVLAVNWGRSLRRYKTGYFVAALLLAGWIWTGSLLRLAALLLALMGLAAVALLGFAPRYGGVRGAQRSLLALSRKWAVQKHWATVCQYTGLSVAGGTAPVPISRVETTPTGVRFTAYPGRVAMTAADVSAAGPRIATSYFATSCRVERGRTPLSLWERLLDAKPIITDAVANVQIDWGNPLERVWRLEDLPASPRGRVVVGLDEDGKPVTLSLLHSILIGGLSGSGKSNLIWAMLGTLLLDRVPFRVWTIDPAEGMELWPLDPAQGGISQRYEDDPAHAKRVVREFRDALARQGRQIREGRERKLSDFSAEHPLMVLIIDEALLVDLDMTPQGELVQAVVTARKYGGAVWVCSQVGTVDALKRLRDAIGQRVAFALPTREQTDAVLGENAYRNGANCPALTVTVEGDESYDVDADQRGVGFVQAPGGRYRMFRAALIPTEEAVQIGRGEVPDGLLEALARQGVVFGADDPLMAARVSKLYRWRGWDVDEVSGEVRSEDALLYVGKTIRPIANRNAEHQRDHDWLDKYGRRQFIEDVPPDRLDEYERAAIRGEPFGEPDGQSWGEVPKYNELLRPDRALAPAARRPARGGGRPARARPRRRG